MTELASENESAAAPVCFLQCRCLFLLIVSRTPTSDGPHSTHHSRHLSHRCSRCMNVAVSLWSNFNSEWLGEASDIGPLLTWILMHADSHIHSHEQLILHHTAQAQHWHKLKRASQRHIAQQTAQPAATLSASPLSPLSTNLILSPLPSPSSSLKRVKPPTDSQLRHRFTTVHSAHTAQTAAGGRGKENVRMDGELEAVVRRVKAAVGAGGSGVKGEAGSASKGVKFAEQAVVIGQGHVPVNDKATKKQLLKEKDRQQSTSASEEPHEPEQAAAADLTKAVDEQSPEQAEKESAKIDEETKEQPTEESAGSQSAIVTPTRKQPTTIDTHSPELVLPSLSALLHSTDDEDSSTVHLHITATRADIVSPSSSPVPPPPPPPSPAVAQSPPPSRLSPFLQFHPSLKEHPYHQTLAAYQSLQSATAVGSPAVPTSAPSLPPRKRPEAPPALSSGVVRFRVDSDADVPPATNATLSAAAGPLSPAPSTPQSASLVSPPPLPPRRPGPAHFHSTVSSSPYCRSLPCLSCCGWHGLGCVSVRHSGSAAHRQ